ncbi:saccharopine dehydrogenase family protein [Corallincola platygyrae]|uniref:Saccharopine dehydrogenase family protein n=1 Tax=Corallincola platygyrae TaxID=1193278 RepID=A0ABW4XQ50_9GAMM
MQTDKYDLIVFGATGFVGQIICRYLVGHYASEDQPLRWAIAGRSKTKLEQLKHSLGQQANDLPIIVANASDEASLLEMCQQTRVVMSTVGPYALYGEPLLKVCAESGTDYCDLTGEPQWIKKMLERYEQTAKASGARIVNCCGFDSIPSDFGVWFIQQQAIAKFGKPLSQIQMRVKAMRGGFSGGTAASLMCALEQASEDPELRREMVNPYSLCPEHHGLNTRQFNQKGPRFDESYKAWSAPFVMAAINTRIVHRSNALTGNSYGSDFQYDEAMLTGRGFKGRLTAIMLTGGLATLMVGGSFSPTRSLISRFMLPKPGEGPSPKAQETGFYDMRFWGQTDDGQTLRAKFTGDKDPGYGSTAKILSQAAICLARELTHEQTPGGFWTPSTAFGEKLLPRLRDYAGVVCELLE